MTDVRIELYPLDTNEVMIPVLAGKVTWKSTREVTPSQLTYTVLKDTEINFPLGTRTALKVNGHLVWVGYTMYKRRTSDQTIECTAYDQLRYLKMKITASYDNLTAGDIIKGIIDQNGLELGTIDQTKEYKLTYVAEDKELLEIVDYVSQMHTAATDEVMIFFDDKGYLSWRKLDSLQVTDTLYTAGRMQDFEYTSSIENSYDSVVVDWLDAGGNDTGKVIKVQDDNHVKYWGLLRYHDQSNEGLEIVKQKAQVLLDELNRETRKLQLKKCLGDVRVRGGSLIPVKLNLGDMELLSMMVVRSVTHTIDAGAYFMDIEAENQALGFADPVSPEGLFEVNKETSSGSSGGGTHLPGNNNIEKVWNMLLDLGYSESARAGILGNMQVESGVEPTRSQYGGGPGMGLCQWEKSFSGDSGRWNQLEAFCAQNGFNALSIEGQCRFLNFELTQTTAGSIGAGFKLRTGMTVQQFKSCNDVYEATKAFLLGFEIPGGGVDAQMQNRYPYAQQFYETYHGYGEKLSMGSDGDGIATGNMVWPAPGVSYITQYYSGPRYDLGQHQAIDIGTPLGTTLVASDGGTVEAIATGYGNMYLSSSGMATYGNYVLINHGNGMKTRYAHMSEVDVQQGQKVSKGQAIGLSGNSGNSSGPHLHFETINNGYCDNPLNYVQIG